MNEQFCKGLLVLLALMTGLGELGVVLASLGMTNSSTTVKTLDRNLEPVILTGRAASALADFSVNELFVYAYSGGAWRQVPAQVDEVSATGAYTLTEDGRLDANDEIVFMAKDLGDQAPVSMPITAGLPISPGWYEIEVTDPISSTRKGWAYLVHSSVLTPTFAADYVNFNTGLHRVNAVAYRLGFGVTHPGLDYLALGNPGVELLDRTKVRVFCRIPFVCPITEQDMDPLPDDLIRDGPVRVIARRGQVLAYGAMVRWTLPFTISRFLRGDVRFSTDFNKAATGATYYNAVVTEGVTVDGITDTVAAKPLSAWWQLATSTGTLIQVVDTSSIGGTPSNYYVDNSAWDGSDTGDRRRYGDTGISIEKPNGVFTYSFAYYMLPGVQPNVGATYAAFFTHPLSTTTLHQGVPRRWELYLPTFMSNFLEPGPPSPTPEPSPTPPTPSLTPEPSPTPSPTPTPTPELSPTPTPRPTRAPTPTQAVMQ